MVHEYKTAPWGPARHARTLTGCENGIVSYLAETSGEIEFPRPSIFPSGYDTSRNLALSPCELPCCRDGLLVRGRCGQEESSKLIFPAARVIDRYRSEIFVAVYCNDTRADDPAWLTHVVGRVAGRRPDSHAGVAATTRPGSAFISSPIWRPSASRGHELDVAYQHLLSPTPATPYILLITHGVAAAHADDFQSLLSRCVAEEEWKAPRSAPTVGASSPAVAGDIDAVSEDAATSAEREVASTILSLLRSFRRPEADVVVPDLHLAHSAASALTDTASTASTVKSERRRPALRSVKPPAAGPEVLLSLVRGFLAGLGGSQIAQLDPVEAERLGTRAAAHVAAGASWREHLGQLLDVKAVQMALGVGTRQAVYDLVKRGRLLGLRRSGSGMLFPAFQFDPATGRPFSVVPELLAVFRAAGIDDYTTATWMSTAQEDLDAGIPREMFGNGRSRDLVVSARRSAERWAQ